MATFFATFASFAGRGPQWIGARHPPTERSPLASCRKLQNANLHSFSLLGEISLLPVRTRLGLSSAEAVLAAMTARSNSYGWGSCARESARPQLA